eukprot:7670176-Karenia_brevis.AAC.1
MAQLIDLVRDKRILEFLHFEDFFKLERTSYFHRITCGADLGTQTIVFKRQGAGKTLDLQIH